MAPDLGHVFPQRANAGRVIGLPPEPGLVSTPRTEGKGGGALRFSPVFGACHRQSIGAARASDTPKRVNLRANLGGCAWRRC